MDRALKKQVRKDIEHYQSPSSAWLRQTKALRPGDPCEWRYPAYPEWHQGTIIQNGGSGYWIVKREDGTGVRGLYVEMIKSAGGSHYEDKL